MQKANLKLREIIWEITGKCANNCLYCGSKEITHSSNPTTEEILDIANNIAQAQHKPDEITISGGDPLCVPYSTHEEMVRILQNSGIEMKILINPISINVDNIDILGLYDVVGQSINTLTELKICKPNVLDTVVTNFNTVNLVMFDQIFKFVKEFKKMWQIQLTIYKDQNDPLAIYNHENVLQLFNEKIQNALNDYNNIVIADNYNDSLCGAGTSTLGILFDGNVVPCLSMRSWCSDIKNKIQGNLHKTTLDVIWRYSFVENRLEEFNCCKDHCKNKFFIQNKTSSQNPPFEEVIKRPPFVVYGVAPSPIPCLAPIDPFPQITLYGVQPPNIVAYGVANPSSTIIWEQKTKNKVND